MSLARRVVTQLVDDLDGSDAVATVAFGLDGTDFEIDLSAVHLAEFRAVLEPFVAAARQVPGGFQGATRRRALRGSDVVARPRKPGVSVRERGRAAAGRPADGTSRAVGGPVASVGPAAAAPAEDVGVSAVVRRRRERQGAPLVVDPFNQDVRFV